MSNTTLLTPHSIKSRDLPPGLFLEDGKLLYQYQSTVYQLCPFPLEEHRIEEVYELSKKAGFDDTLEDWKQHLRFARFAYAFIDLKTDRLITTGMAVVFDNRLVRIIDILTDSAHGNRGLAKTLFGYLLYLIGEDPGLESLELEASALGCGLYEKFSFEIDYKIVSYVHLNLESKNDAHSPHLIDDNDLEMIIELDTDVCGFSRARVIREVPRNQIFVDKVNQQVVGFLFYFEDSNGIRIGPWIHAREEDAGKFFCESFQIISSRYPLKKKYIHVPDFYPEQDSAVLRTLKELGFTKDDTIQTNHMFKGVKISRNKSHYLAMWSTNWS